MSMSIDTVKQEVRGCKLFASFTDSAKQHILAAIDDPRNQELVKQIASYLSDETKEDLQPKTSEDGETAGTPAGRKVTAIHPVEDTSKSTLSTHEDSKESEDVPDESSEGMLKINAPIDSKEPNTSEDSEQSKESAEEDAVESSKVMLTTNIQDAGCAISSACEFADCEVLQGTLNNRADTAGVTRVRVHEDEVWVYYNDKTNLNNIMLSVVETVSNSEFADLEFNRLARTENAMVFQYIPKTC